MTTYSCCICGTLLANVNRIDLPKWCRLIRALCNIESQIVLTGTGFLDDEDLFDLPIHLPVYLLGRYQLPFRGSVGSCFPFHAACWALLEDSQGEEIDGSGYLALYEIFQSIHFYRGALQWGHKYGGASYCQDRRWNEDDLGSFYTADPQHFSFLEEEEGSVDPTIVSRMTGARNGTYKLSDHVSKGASSRNSRNPLETIPTELRDTILAYLSFKDVQNLLCTCSHLYLLYANGLPDSFWQSRFYPNSEAGFARSIRPKSHSWKSWFLALERLMKVGPISTNLYNRLRIWKLGLDLLQLMQTKKSRHASGVIGKIDGSPAFKCLPSNDSQDGCRELHHRLVLFPAPEDRLCSLTPTYISINQQKLVSGLTFGFTNGTSLDVGYVANGGVIQDGLKEHDVLWFLFCSQGVKMVTLQAMEPRDKHAIAKVYLKHCKGIIIGLDAMRIVSVYTLSTLIQEIYWTPSYPSMTPFIEESDFDSVKSLQKGFAPASFFIPTKAIKAISICTSLGPFAGIDGIKFIYIDDREDIWGSCDDVASLTYFLDPRKEKVIKLILYKTGIVIYHIEIITNLGRTSGLLPSYFAQQMDVIEYEALQNGTITGLWGCYTVSEDALTRFPNPRLAYLGVFTDTKIEIRRSSPIVLDTESPRVSMTDTKIQEIPLSLGRHGSFRTSLVLDQPYQAVQASIIPTTTKYRCQGQVTGLLFYPARGQYPTLVGYWTGPGERYDFTADEEVTGITFNCCTTRWKNTKHRSLSQVQEVALRTSVQSYTWGLKSCSPTITLGQGQRLKEITWEFNAIYDRIGILPSPGKATSCRPGMQGDCPA